jgi:membrane-bound lytic murein transglycosylase D
MKIGIIYLLLIVVISCSDNKNLASQNKSGIENSNSNFLTYLSSQKLPYKLELFGEKIPLDIPEIKERAEREFYLNLQQPGQMILYIKRSGKYFPIFERIIVTEGLPNDIKYLSVAESALYMSKSPKDAVGLWQFIPPTGRAMGLQIDEFVDERRHPIKSTKAAMKYLKNGFQKYKSWVLAAAGYNMGHENVADNIEFQDVKTYFDLFLNEETSRYILRIAIIKEIMENPKKYGINLGSEDIYKADDVKYIEVNSAIPNLAEWAKKNGSSYKDVKLLNPWILQRKLPAPMKGNSYSIAIKK